MANPAMTPEVKQKIAKLLKDNPTSKPSEIREMLLKSDKKLTAITVQSIVAVKKKPPELIEAPEEAETTKVVASKTRKFKNLKTGATFEVKEGEPFRHFHLPGETKAYSLDDFKEMIRKHCGEVKEVNAAQEITELPMENLNVADLFAAGCSGN